MQLTVDSPEWRVLEKTADRLVELEERVGLEALPDEERVFFLVWIADGEVRNGGMHAVCYNSTGDYLRSFPEAFEAIGAPRKAELFVTLMRIFGFHGPSPDHEIRMKQHASLSDDAGAQIDALDDAYFSAPEPIDVLLARWCESWAAGRLGT
jgi:hypothetical protein